MLLFLVRHARSETPKDRWQTPSSHLGRVGIRQAQVLSERSRFSKIDKVFSSGWDRSGETAVIVSENLGVDAEVLDYIHERRQAQEIYGVSRDSEVSRKYAEEYNNNYRNLDWKFAEGEESIREVLGRATRLAKFLKKNYRDKQVVVVSHDIFIRCFLSQALLGENYSDEAMVKVFNSMIVTYTGISLLKYGFKKRFWRIYYVNDFSHHKQLGKRGKRGN